MEEENRMMKKLLIIFNVLIAVISFFTFIVGNVIITFGNKVNGDFFVLGGYAIIIVPILISFIVNMIMLIKIKQKVVNNIFLNLLIIIVINIVPYLTAYLIFWNEI